MVMMVPSIIDLEEHEEAAEEAAERRKLPWQQETRAHLLLCHLSVKILPAIGLLRRQMELAMMKVTSAMQTVRSSIIATEAVKAGVDALDPLRGHSIWALLRQFWRASKYTTPV